MNVRELKRQLKALYLSAFEDGEAFASYYINHYSDVRRAVVETRDGNIISALHLIEKKLWLRGVALRMPFVSAAATLPELRGQGIFRRVMSRTLEQLHAEGAPFCALQPFKHEYYRQFGFATGSFSQNLRIEKCTKKEDGVAEFVPSTPELLLQIYNDYAGQFAGYLLRTEEDFAQRLTLWKNAKCKVGVIRKGGQMCYFSADAAEDRLEEAGGDLDIIGLSRPCIMHSCYDPVSSLKETISEPETMYRLLNVKTLLEGITYARDGETVFCLQDDILTQNCGFFRLIVRGGAGRLEKIDSTADSDRIAKVTQEDLLLSALGAKMLFIPLVTLIFGQEKPRPQIIVCFDKY